MKLTPTNYANQVLWSIQNQHGPSLATALDLADRASDLFEGLNPQDRTLDIARASYEGQYKRLGSPWAEIVTAHTRAIVASRDTRADPVTGRATGLGDALGAYESQQQLVDSLYRWMLNSTTPTAWVLPALYVVCKDLKNVATNADQVLLMQGNKPTKLEEASRMLQKCFSACLNDRDADVTTSRKMGTYYMATLLFKTYFKLKSTALCKNIIRGIKAANLAPFERYPVAHRTTYLYYMGVFAFLREDYTEAEASFVRALGLTHKKATRNIELILDYLIPVLLLRGVLPSPLLLSSSSRLGPLYRPFIHAFRTGDVNLYDRQLRAAEKRLMERGTYLVVERAREGAVRALLKKAWILEGKPPRMAVGTFVRYLNVGMGGEGERMDGEEVECVLANLIAKGRLKGYIAHAQQIVVLSKDKPFPWYAPIRELAGVAKDARARREEEARQKMPAPELLVTKPVVA